ncbi:MAG TPA: heme ABC exporter ATP-binding protein CcmA [Acidisphaera sp.]|nr:heme ABC exporter ATP-binding protein CcmA [Acidisphaera sp.]
MLTARALAAFRGGRLVFRDIDFDLAAGGALLLSGPNGSGKSTLLRILAGLAPAETGQLLWDSTDALADPISHARRLAFVGHTDAVKPGLTVSENLLFAAHAVPGSTGKGAKRTGRDAAIADALDAVGLGALADLPARYLSAGQRRRLALARLALRRDAPLWLLDEPTLGLDVASVARLGALLQAHREAGGLVIAATHLPLPLAGAGELRLQ